MKRILIGLVSVGALLAADHLIKNMVAVRADQISQFEQNKENADKVYKDLQKKEHEKEMRATDRTHGDRPMIAPGVSVGGSMSPPEINIRVGDKPTAPDHTPSAPAVPEHTPAVAPPAITPYHEHRDFGGGHEGGHGGGGWAGPDRGSDKIGRTV